MYPGELFDGLQLDHNCGLNYQIRAEAFVKPNALEFDRDHLLPLDPQTSLSKRVSETQRPRLARIVH